ncbi:MAG: hypothetical protein AAGF56_06310 [Pseudomonadota bacterium]
MYHVANTDELTADGVISNQQAEEIKARARAAMIALCVNTLLIGGVVAATLGLIFFLADAVSVAVFGGLFLGGGLAILRYGAPLYRMFGNASAVIGAGMLIGGAGIEIADKLPDTSGLWLLATSTLIGALFLWRFTIGQVQLRFAYGAALLMAACMHISGAYVTAEQFALSGWPMPLIHAYVTALLVGLGLRLDVRFITALAIAPFAQMLDTGTYYFHAAYVFYSPESTLSILQMSVLIGLCLWAVTKGGPVIKRQAGVLMIMGFVVANLCFLVGSLWGDVVGSHVWGPTYADFEGDWQAYNVAKDAFAETAFVINEHVYSIVWALALGAVIIWSAFANRRGLFNAGMTMAGIHAYTQMFETFYDEPLAYVIGGLVAIPLAFGLWRLNTVWFGDDRDADIAGIKAKA